jgi:uncharacterized protein YjgD (DUF1641 family)
MAKPIQLDIPTRDHKTELQRRLDAAPVEHAAAILDFIELLEVLHKHEVLSTVRGAVGAGDHIITQLARAAAQPESIRAMRNLLAFGKILGSIDPELIEAVQRSIPRALQDRNARRAVKAPSMWRVIRTFFSPPVQRALVATGFVLAGVGYYLNKESAELADKD